MLQQACKSHACSLRRRQSRCGGRSGDGSPLSARYCTSTLPFVMLNRPPFPSGWASLALSPSNLTLANTLPVGQSFLWHRHAVSGAGPSDPVEEYSRAIKGRPPKVVLLRQSPTHLHYVAVHPDGTLEEADRTRKWLSDYFRLDSHPRLDDLYADWRRKDPGLFGRTELDRRAIGVRVLRQDPWECLLASVLLFFIEDQHVWPRRPLD